MSLAKTSHVFSPNGFIRAVSLCLSSPPYRSSTPCRYFIALAQISWQGLAKTSHVFSLVRKNFPPDSSNALHLL